MPDKCSLRCPTSMPTTITNNTSTYRISTSQRRRRQRLTQRRRRHHFLSSPPSGSGPALPSPRRLTTSSSNNNTNINSTLTTIISSNQRTRHSLLEATAHTPTSSSINRPRRHLSFSNPRGVILRSIPRRPSILHRQQRRFFSRTSTAMTTAHQEGQLQARQ